MNSLQKMIAATGELLFSSQITVGQRITIVKYIVATKIFKKSKIRSMELIHTLQCNCRCAFCSNEKLSEQSPRMNREDVFRTIDRIAEHGSVAIIFLGGESLTDNYFAEYIRYTRKKRLIPLLQTNGSLLTERKIKEIAEAGIFSVTITIHDAIAEKHNSVVKCDNAFETIVAAISLLKKYHIKTVLKTLYSRESIANGSFDRILTMARKYALSLNVNPMMPVGRGMGEENMLNEVEKEDYLTRILSESTITSHTKNEYDNQCPGGHLYLGILPDGEILPCYFLPISVGNIKNTTIDEARKRAENMNLFLKGTDSCIVSMDKQFYQTVIRELYSGNYELPAKMYKDDRVIKFIERFHITKDGK